MAIRYTTEQNKHSHLFYEEALQKGPSSTTIDKKHLHEIMVVDGQVVIMEAEGHTHEPAQEYVFELPADPETDETKTPSEEESRKVTELMEMYQQAKADEKDCRDKGDESYKFRYGQPWTDEDKDALKKQSRACLAVDEIAAMVELLIGYQQQNRTDIFVKPTEEGDQAVAEILNILIKNILDRNNYVYEESRAFEDEVVVGRGFFMVYSDYERDPLGEIRIEHMPWDKPYMGPHDKLDASDMEYMVLTDEYSKAKLVRLFPEKKDSINTFFAKWTDESQSSIQARPGETYKTSSDDKILRYGSEAVANLATKEVKVFERWMKEFYTSYIAMDKETANVVEIDSADKDRIKSLGFEIITRSAYRMRITKTAGTVLLSDEYTDAKDFPVIVAYANKYKEKFQGKVEPLKDAAREIDKRRSQLADYLNAAMGAMFVQEDSMSPQEFQKFTKNATNPRHVCKVSDINLMPRRADATRIPVEFVQEDALSSQKLQVIANMRDLAGFQQSNVSGRALMVQRRASLVGNDFLFDHLDLAKKVMALRIIDMIQKIYTPDRIARIIMSQNQGRVQVQEQEVQFTPESINELLTNADLTKYDVVIDESPHSKTMNELTFQMLSELRQQGVQDIDTLTLIDLSPVPLTTKNTIKRGIMQMRQQMAQAEQAKQQSEVEKSMPDEAKIALLEQRRQGAGMGQPQMM